MDNKLPNEILHKINDFRVGDDIHWKSKFNDVVNQLNDVEFFCKTHWCSNECNVCNKCHNDYTIELKYDEALKTYLNDYVGRKCSWCNCKILNCKISFVNEQNYYYMLDYWSSSEYSDDDDDYDDDNDD